MSWPRSAAEKEALAPRVILASRSPARARVLTGAGVPCRIAAATVDEREIKTALRAEGQDVNEVSVLLAEAKARCVSATSPGALVIGADQILVCGDVWYDKPADLAEARVQLEALRGRSHELVSGVCAVRDENLVWRHSERARLAMRPFSDVFLERYLEEIGEAALQGVGAYQLEGRGAQLFSRVEGDYFAILGLPLWPLLDFLRAQRVVPT